METNIEKFDARDARPVVAFPRRAARLISSFFDLKRRWRQWRHVRELASMAKLLHTTLPPMPAQHQMARVQTLHGPVDLAVLTDGPDPSFQHYLQRSPHGEEIRALFVVTGAAVQTVNHTNYTKFILDYPIPGASGDVFRRLIDDPITPDAWRARLAELAGDAEDAAKKRGPLHRNGVIAERAAP